MTVVDQRTDSHNGDDLPGVLRDLIARSNQRSKLAASEVFAWPEARLFPISNAEDIILSAAYAIKQGAAVPAHVYNILRSTVQAHGQDWDGLAASLTTYAQRKTAAAAPVRAVPAAAFAFPGDQRLPLQTPALTVKSAAALAEQWRLVPYHAASDAAERVIQAAQHQGVPVPGQLWKLAGRAEPCRENYARQIDARKRLLASVSQKLAGAGANAARLGAAQEKIASSGELYEAGIRLYDQVLVAGQKLSQLSTQRDVSTVALLLKQADEATGLDQSYGSFGIEPPEMAVLGTEPAQEMLQIGPSSYPVDALAGLPLSFWQDALGPEFASEVQDPSGQTADLDKLIAIIPTLPLEMRQSLTVSLRSAGVRG